MSQTTIQKSSAIRKGSVRVQIGTSFGALTDIGALRDPVFTALVQNQSVEFDNVDDLKKFVDGKRVQFAFNLAEINLTHIAQLDSGLATLSTVAGTIVSGASQVVASGSWNYNKFIKIENQNGDGSAITVNSVTLGTDGVLIADTDFYVGQNAQGEYGIFVIDSATVTTEAQSATIDYDYTPNASKKLTFTTSGTKDLTTVVRVVNTDENGKEFKIDIENVTNLASTVIDFAGDTEEDVAVLPMTLEGDIVEVVDEQQTT